MGLFYLSLESGFLCFMPLPAGLMIPSASCFGIFPSQKSGGKDKKMMNMMTGAVAINGGVGVMEIRQPMEKNMAQAAEQVALNAHITLRELKTMIDTVVEKQLPTFKTLMEMKPVAVAQTTVNGAKLTAYENGYAVYEVDNAHTVMAVERCGDYRYVEVDYPYFREVCKKSNAKWCIGYHSLDDMKRLLILVKKMGLRKVTDIFEGADLHVSITKKMQNWFWDSNPARLM